MLDRVTERWKLTVRIAPNLVVKSDLSVHGSSCKISLFISRNLTKIRPRGIGFHVPDPILLSRIDRVDCIERHRLESLVVVCLGELVLGHNVLDALGRRGKLIDNLLLNQVLVVKGAILSVKHGLGVALVQ